jgi:hypothetical protein
LGSEAFALEAVSLLASGPRTLGPVLDHLLEGAKRRVTLLARATQLDDLPDQLRFEEIATTLTAVVVERALDGSIASHCSWVGDSPCYVLGPTGWSRIAPAPSSAGELASSVTAALPTHPDDLGELSLTLKPGEVLFAMTDGLGDPLGDGTGVVGRTLASWWSSAPSAAEFYEQLSFHRATFDDDRTAVAVWTRPS